MTSAYRFRNGGRSMVIRTPAPPRAWVNYLWNDSGYLARITQHGSGESQYLTPDMQLEMMNEKRSRFLYLRDDESNVSWNPGFAPLYQPVEDFECEHSLAYTEVRSGKNGIRASIRYIVPENGLFEIWRVTLANTSGKARKLSVFAAMDMDLKGDFPQPRYYGNGALLSMTFEGGINGIYGWVNNPYAPHDKFKGFLASSIQVHAYDCSAVAFCGGDTSFSHPLVVMEGRDCTNSSNISDWVTNTAILQNKIELQPGETKEVLYCTGFCSSLDDAKNSVARAFQKNFFEDTTTRAECHWEDIIAHCSIETPDEKVNNLMNVWVKKQMILCRVGKKGVRDNMQIADGVLQIWPDGGRAEILEVLSHQYQDGHTVLTWFPLDETYYSDQPIWLVMGVTGYIKETGDYSILDENVPYQDGGEGTVWEHLLAGLSLKESDLGPNGLCRLRFADWNDALNVYTDENAESVFVIEGLAYMLKEMAALSEQIGKKDFAARCRAKHREVAQRINEVAWMGEYYSMVHHKDGIIGGPDSEGSKIFINPQTWAILGEVVPPDRLPVLLKSMDEKIEHDFGLPINWPPYEKHSFTIGRMGAFPPGAYENGGTYCHATGFGIVANAKVGRGDVALRLLKKIMPDSEKNPSSLSGADPHVFTNCYQTNSKRYGWSGASWMTGTSVWCFKGLVEGILGVQRGYAGLTIDPAMPSCWKRAKVVRKFRGATYSIEILNPYGLQKGALEITVDGKPNGSNILPVFSDGKKHDVKVTILERAPINGDGSSPHSGQAKLPETRVTGELLAT